jgi:hypothetical protein
MTKKRIFSIAVAASCVLGLGAARLWAGDDAPPPCKRTEFKTKMVADACASGGAKAANDAMKAFVKQVKEAKQSAGEEIQLTCQTCHTDIKKSGGYPLKPDGLKEFEKLQAFLASNAKK